MKNIGSKSKSSGVKSGIAIRGGAGGMLHGTARTGPQAPGVSGVSKGAGNSSFSVSPGRGGMLSGTKVSAAKSGGTTGGGGRKRYADDAGGNTMGSPGSKSS